MIMAELAAVKTTLQPEEIISSAPPTGKTIYQRMAGVMRDVRGVGKDSHNSQGNYRYAGHEAVTDALRNAYVKHGIVRTASVIKTEVLDHGVLLLTVQVSWICDDHPASRLVVEMPGLQSSVKKDGGMAPVQVGMALSYAVKNAEFKCFALTGDDTPDTEQADNDRDDDREPQRGGPGLASTNRGPSQAPSSGRPDPIHIAVEYLERFSECKTADEVKALNDLIKKNWDAVRTVPEFADQLVAARRKAGERIRAAAAAPRQAAGA
jgi:hypothetical protein